MQPVKAFERPAQLNSYLQRMLDKIADSNDSVKELEIAMLNDGNFVDIANEYKRQQYLLQSSSGYRMWQTIAQKILSIQDNADFKLKRTYIMQQPFNAFEGVSISQAVQISKTVIGVPQEVSWDAISYKIQPFGFEYFLIKNPQYLQQLTQADSALLYEAQLQAMDELQIALAQGREKEETTEDSMISDLSVVLENIIAGTQIFERKWSIQDLGDAELMGYVTSSVQAFSQGVIPGSVQPGKITACQDTVSMTELQSSIQMLAQDQIWQISQQIDNPNIRQVTKNMTDGSSKWTSVQQNSISVKASITEQAIKARGTVNDDFDQPMKEIGNQISGGPNDLNQARQLGEGGAVVNLSPVDKEILTQSLSLLLACLRIRYNATLQSSFELVAQEDIDHLHILERLTSYVDPQPMMLFKEQCATLLEGITNGHNKVRLLNRGPSLQTAQDAFQRMERRAEIILKGVRLFDADLKEGKELFKQLLTYMTMSMTDINRIQVEKQERYARRFAIFQQLKDV